MKRPQALRVRIETVIDKGVHRISPSRNEGSAGEGMRFGEEEGRYESFTRYIRVLGGDLVEAVAVQQPRFDGIRRDARALDNRRAALDFWDAFDPGIAHVGVIPCSIF
ncbi:MULTISPECIES: hypothetical protein [unclassified Methylocystis]|uniref:hypothetical protein n=1 Tax=unclassified Methylocystis TaxID=2625913 RepID=UPI001FEDA76B|nr:MULTISPECIES: hypothetical protein [unclassified Methylocystis]